jgi:hypothetical protein
MDGGIVAVALAAAGFCVCRHRRAGPAVARRLLPAVVSSLPAQAPVPGHLLRREPGDVDKLQAGVRRLNGGSSF